MYETINSPINYGGLTLKNRIIFAPTSMGLPEDELIARYRAIAAGGCTMIILGDVPVLKHGFGPSLYTKRALPSISALPKPSMRRAACCAHNCTSRIPTSRQCSNTFRAY